MPNWKTASPRDRKKLAAIQILLRRYPKRVNQIFNSTEPSLKISPQGLVARGMPIHERLLVRLAYDVWMSGLLGIKIKDLEILDDADFKNVVEALTWLRLS